MLQFSRLSSMLICIELVYNQSCTLSLWLDVGRLMCSQLLFCFHLSVVAGYGWVFIWLLGKGSGSLQLVCGLYCRDVYFIW